MAEPPPVDNPNETLIPSYYHPEPPPAPHTAPSSLSFLKRPSIRVTSEFDSDTGVFLQKISTKVLNNIAKLKLSFQNSRKGEVADPHVSLITKHLSIRYDIEENNAFLNCLLNIGPNVNLKASHHFKAQQGELSMIGNLSDPGYKFELASSVPSAGLPNATLKFPCGEVSLEEREDDEEKKVLSINGVVNGSILNGRCTAMYKDESLNLRYCYKDEEMSFIPSIYLPSNAVSFAFKRRFGPADKLSYWYNFDTNSWSTVYKHTVGKDYKVKAGYDSEIRLGWASLWIGDEGGKTKTAPMKMKVQFMLQVPQDDVKTSVLMFRVKKRWDI